MKPQLMTQAQESTPTSALWTVDDGEAMSLSIGPGERELTVTTGRLWLTREGTASQPAEDLWLSAGDTLAMASGSKWVAEGWGATRFQLLVPPRACATQHRSARSQMLRGSSLVASLRPAF
jgi:hypothetical protein